ncbi:MAG: DUF2934 domain-containing protein [Candidatus Thiodiazotropha sp.]
MAKKSGKEKEQKKLRKAEKKNAKKEKKAGKQSTKPTAEERFEMIATAAYYIAEKHGFDPERSTQDWHQAELQIDAKLKSHNNR